MQVDTSLTKTIIIPFFLILFLVGCKGTKSSANDEKVYQILILLKSERSTLGDIESLNAEEIIQKNRISRSQNKWSIEVKKSPVEIEKLIESLRQNSKVESAELSTTGENKASNAKNIRS